MECRLIPTLTALRHFLLAHVADARTLQRNLLATHHAVAGLAPPTLFSRLVSAWFFGPVKVPTSHRIISSDTFVNAAKARSISPRGVAGVDCGDRAVILIWGGSSK
jgi:hypothetical protein